MNLRNYINELEKNDLLIKVQSSVDPYLELTKIMQQHPDKAVLFEKVKGTDFPLIGNLLCSKKWFEKVLHLNKMELYERIQNSANVEMQIEEVNSSKTFDIELDVNLDQLPIPHFFREDGGKYLTSAIVAAKNPDSGKTNYSIHRIMILSHDTGVIRLVPRDLYHIVQSNKKQGKNTPIALIVGYHPIIALAASTPTKYGESELVIAGAIMGQNVKVIKTPKHQIEVPIDVEFILEGEILANKTAEEGPFVDITGTYDSKRFQPVIKFQRMYHRKNAIFQTILPAYEEHYILMGFPREAAIYSYAKKVVPEVHDVTLTSGGCGWLHAVISITPQKMGDAKNVALAAFAAHPSLKWCTIVNDDIDVTNPKSVEWATITRAGHGDVIVLENFRGSSLDPSRKKEDETTIKVIIDATKKKNRDEQEYNRVI